MKIYINGEQLTAYTGTVNSTFNNHNMATHQSCWGGDNTSATVEVL